VLDPTKQPPAKTKRGIVLCMADLGRIPGHSRWYLGMFGVPAGTPNSLGPSDTGDPLLFLRPMVRVLPIGEYKLYAGSAIRQGCTIV